LRQGGERESPFELRERFRNIANREQNLAQI
jgi:hypothetical protein